MHDSPSARRTDRGPRVPAAGDGLARRLPRVHLARRHLARRMCDMSSAGGSPHEACMRACLDHTPLYPPTLFHRPGARAPSQRAAGCLGSPCARTSRDLKCCSYLVPRFSRASLCSEGREGCLSPISVNYCPWSRLIRPPLSLSRHGLGAFPGERERAESHGSKGKS